MSSLHTILPIPCQKQMSQDGTRSSPSRCLHKFGQPTRSLPPKERCLRKYMQSLSDHVTRGLMDGVFRVVCSLRCVNLMGEHVAYMQEAMPSHLFLDCLRIPPLAAPRRVGLFIYPKHPTYSPSLGKATHRGCSHFKREIYREA